MYDRTMEPLLKRIESHLEAQNQLLTLATMALMTTAPNASVLREVLATAATYKGPSPGRAEFAEIAESILRVS